MKRYLITWTEEIKSTSSTIIEAEDPEQAMKKWKNKEYDRYDRDEYDTYFVEESEEIREIE